MAFEKILEFGEGNRYKVKFEVANIDTSTVDDVELDEEIASLEKVSETDYAFNVREYYSAEGARNRRSTCAYETTKSGYSRRRNGVCLE